MNYLVDYKTKYLKYKNKYLQLKNLNGGANCPNIGHHQHLGECWHDSYTMIMLYSDDIGNYLQHIFDSHQFANIDHLIKDLFSFGYENMPNYLLPFNIYKGNYRDRQMFEHTATSYIKNLYERYINEKREGIPKERELFDPKKIYRQDSTVPSLTCTLDIYQIANYGNIKPSPFTIEEHGGNVYQLYFPNSFINYLLLNYILPEERPIEKPIEKPKVVSGWDDDYKDKQEIKTIEPPKKDLFNRYIREKNYEIFYLFSEKFDADKIITTLKEMLLDIDLTTGILIKSSVYKNDKFAGGSHVQAFLTCDQTELFYDDNGIIKITEQIGGILPEDRRKLERDILKLDDGILEKKFLWDTFSEFRWKEYMKEQIRKIITSIQNHINKTKVLSPGEFNNLKFVLSDLYKIFDQTVEEGEKGEYIRYINEFTFYIIEQFGEEDIISKKNSYLSNIYDHVDSYHEHDINQNKVFNLIDNEDIVQLEIMLKFDLQDKIDEYKEYAREKRKPNSFELLRKIKLMNT